MQSRALGTQPVARDTLLIFRGSQDAVILCSDPSLLRRCPLGTHSQRAVS